MKRSEAVALLAACRSLAYKLAEHGVYIDLAQEDRVALQGFKRVWLDGWDWMVDLEVHRLTGLSTIHLGLLDFKARFEHVQEMRRQHASGEQVED